MNRFFVYFEDGYADTGDVGMRSFATREEAEGYIADRLTRADKPNLDDYIVVEGRQLTVTGVKFATKITLT